MTFVRREELPFEKPEKKRLWMNCHPGETCFEKEMGRWGDGEMGRWGDLPCATTDESRDQCEGH